MSRSQPRPSAPASVEQVIGHYANPVPRTIKRLGDWLLLDGEWQFALDLANRGLAERWMDGHSYRATAHWPGAIEAQMAAAAQIADQDEVIAWYERTFTVPPSWGGELVQVTFGAVGYETMVWLNGVLLRTVEGEEVHTGEYTSFSYELPAELRQPVDRLTVRIRDTLDAEIPRGKQASRIYKRGGIWYQTYSGPARSVWLEVVERNRLRSHLTVESQVESRVVTLGVTARVYDAGQYTLRVNLRPVREDTVLAERAWPLPLDTGVHHQRVALTLPTAELWAPGHPALYRMTAQLIAPDGVVSQIAARVGLRRIEARGTDIYLNNQRIYLDGILYQPIGVSWEQIKQHLRAMSALGCNLVRIHISGIDPRMYDLADELGMLLWVEVPSPHASSARSRRNHWAELVRMLRVIGAHPSVVILSLYNEDWGIQDIATDPEARAYIAQCYDYLQVRGPQVLVVDNDGWQHVSRNGQLQSNLLTAHIYRTDVADWAAHLTRLVAGDLTATPEPLVVGDPFFYEGQLPLVISEWGGFGFSGYGGPGADQVAARTRTIRAFKHALRARAVAGDVYTQATNVEDERNGLIGSTGELLVPPGILRSRQSRGSARRKGGTRTTAGTDIVPPDAPP